jgi:hypothetical protein
VALLVPNVEPTQLLPLLRLRQVLAVDLPQAFDGLKWHEEDDAYFVEMPATRADGSIDTYLTKWTFAFYPGQPPHVTFVNPVTKLYDPHSWPVVTSQRTSLSPNYPGAPEGLICNSMFYDWYYYGGHGNQPAVSWLPGVHKAIATVTELREILRQPQYKGPR